MADVVKRIEYYYTVVPDRAGAGAKVLNALKAGRVNLLAFTGFPCGAGRTQLDFVPSNQRRFRAAARKTGIKLVGPKTAFLIQGQDRVGAIADIANKLAEVPINITSYWSCTSPKLSLRAKRKFAGIGLLASHNFKRSSSS